MEASVEKELFSKKMAKQDFGFNKNEDVNKQLWDAVQAKQNKIELGGGEKSA